MPISLSYSVLANYEIVTITGSETLPTDKNLIVLVNNSTTVNLIMPPAAQVKSQIFTVKKISNNAFAVNLVSGTFDGETTLTIDCQYTAVGLVSDGTGWYVI